MVRCIDCRHATWDTTAKLGKPSLNVGKSFGYCAAPMPMLLSVHRVRVKSNTEGMCYPFEALAPVTRLDGCKCTDWTIRANRHLKTCVHHVE